MTPEQKAYCKGVLVLKEFGFQNRFEFSEDNSYWNKENLRIYLEPDLSQILFFNKDNVLIEFSNNICLEKDFRSFIKKINDFNSR